MKIIRIARESYDFYSKVKISNRHVKQVLTCTDSKVLFIQSLQELNLETYAFECAHASMILCIHLNGLTIFFYFLLSF